MVPGRSGQHGPAAVLPAAAAAARGLRRAARAARRTRRWSPRSAGGPRSARPGSLRPCRRARSGSCSRTVDREPHVRADPGRTRHAPRRPAASGSGRPGRARSRRHRSPVRPPGRRESTRSVDRSGRRVDGERGQGDLVLDRLLPAEQPSAVDLQLRVGANRSRVHLARSWSWRKRRCTVTSGPPRRPARPAGTGWPAGRPRPARPRQRPAVRARRTASAPGSWPRWPGTDRAGSPRRGRRRPRSGPGRGSMRHRRVSRRWRGPKAPC